MSASHPAEHSDPRATLWSAALALGLVLVQAAAVAHLTGDAGDAAHRADMVALVLGVNAVALALGCWRSTFPFAVHAVDPLGAAVIVAATGAFSAHGEGLAAPITVVAGTAVASGLLLLLLGWSRRIRLLDPIPLPMMGAMMGTVGMVGIASGFAIALDRRLDQAAIADPQTWPTLTFVALAGLATWALARNRAQGPVLVGAVAIVSLVALGVPANVGATREVASPVLAARTAIHVDDLLAFVPVLVAVAFMTALRQLAHVRVLEEEAGFDANPEREFRLIGLTSVASAVVCGAPTTLVGEASTLVATAGQHARKVVAVLAVACGGLAFVAGPLLAAIPATAIGVLMVAMGLAVLDRWVLQTGERAAPIEVAALIAVLALTLVFGPVQGVLAGTGLGAVGFALAYSRSRPVRARYAGNVAVSNVVRSPPEHRILMETAAARVVMHLQGFLFFGTADRLLGEIRSEFERSGGQLRYLVLDFGGVDGADSSAVASFGHICRETAAQGVTLCLSQMPERLAQRLYSAHDFDPPPRPFASLDLALEFAETETLKEHAGDAPLGEDLPTILEAEMGAETARRVAAAMQRAALAPGDMLMRQGEASNDLLFLSEGRASVFMKTPGGKEARVRSFGPGTMIGEMAFHLETPRTATVIADTPCEVYRLDRACLERLEREDAGAALALHAFITRRLCFRILDKDHLVTSLMMVSRQL